MLVLAILSATILPILLMLSWNSRAQPEALSVSMAAFSASRLAAAVNSVGSLGSGSALRTQIELPNVIFLQASGREIVVRVNTSYGLLDLVQPTRFNISSSGFSRIGAAGAYVIDVHGAANMSATNVTLELN